jgi:hypothetical protein
MEALLNMVRRVFFERRIPASYEELMAAYTVAFHGQIAMEKRTSRRGVCDYLISVFSDDAVMLSEKLDEASLLRWLDVVFDYSRRCVSTRRCVDRDVWEKMRQAAVQKHDRDADRRHQRAAYDIIARRYLEHAYRPASTFARRAATRFRESAQSSGVDYVV